MLKRYWERDEYAEASDKIEAAVLEPQDDDGVATVEMLTNGQEDYKDVHINPQLRDEQINEVKELLYEYRDIFSDIPQVTNLGEHQITLTTDEPIRGKAYPLPYAMKVLDKEIDLMLRMDVIEPSTAAYASPIVLVKKPDGSTRVCVDYRKMNKATLFDPEPAQNADEIFAKLAGSAYFTNFDPTKGYWQSP